MKTENIPLLTPLTPPKAYSMLYIPLGLADDAYYGIECTISIYEDILYETVKAHNVPGRMHDQSLQFILSESFVSCHFICSEIPQFHTTPCQKGEWRQYLF